MVRYLPPLRSSKDLADPSLPFLLRADPHASLLDAIKTHLTTTLDEFKAEVRSDIAELKTSLTTEVRRLPELVLTVAERKELQVRRSSLFSISLSPCLLFAECC